MDAKFEISKEFLSSLQWIRLDDLFNLPYEELPSWVWTSNVVYYCRNTHNDKGYVGETTQCLIDRWRGDGLLNHQSHINYDYNTVYKALRKYESSKFILTILQKDFDSDKDRKSSEKYWIKELHTYIDEWGYNMTLGGDTNDQLRRSLLELYPESNGTPPQFWEAGNKALKSLWPGTNGVPPKFLEAGRKRMKELYPETNGMPPQCIEAAHTPEVSKRRMETDKNNHDGVLAIHTEESRKRAIETRIKIYGSSNGAMLTPEARNKSRETQFQKFGCYAFNTPEAREKAYATQRLNNNGRLAFNTEEAYKKSEETKAKIYGNPYAPILSDSSRLASNITRMFNGIIKRIESIKSQGLPLTLDSYISTLLSNRNLNALEYYLEYLYKDKRWTDEMTQIFEPLLTKMGLESSS